MPSSLECVDITRRALRQRPRVQLGIVRKLHRVVTTVDSCVEVEAKDGVVVQFLYVGEEHEMNHALPVVSNQSCLASNYREKRMYGAVLPVWKITYSAQC